MKKENDRNPHGRLFLEHPLKSQSWRGLREFFRDLSTA
jgi:hypothetical protein